MGRVPRRRKGCILIYVGESTEMKRGMYLDICRGEFLDEERHVSRYM
tara:strand:+ start:662 stop:802 length:141 start_codon:yes stop_codon:yes gene_type:complete